MMRSWFLYILICSSTLTFLTGCQVKNARNDEYSEIKVTKLKDYHTFISSQNLVVGQPARVKYDNGTGHIFIQDFAKSRIIEMDESGKVVHIYSRRGHGPGETEDIANFFITAKHLFIVDDVLFLIDKYNLRDGQFIASLDYGQYLLKIRQKSNGPPPPPPPPRLPLVDMNNEPFVTLKETILLPYENSGKFVYEEINWNGKKLSEFGAIPKGYKATEDVSKVWTMLANRKIPAVDLGEVFPVSDRADSNDIFLVYSAIPEIAKYSLSGREIWEHKIPDTPEIDSLMINLSNFANMVRNRDHTRRVAPIQVRKYVTGRSSPDGDLYLMRYMDLLQIPGKNTPSLWIHEFDSSGKLIKRYQIISHVDLFYYPGIDFKKNRIFVPLLFLKNIGIRTYHY